MIKTIIRTLILLVISITLGWGTYLLIQQSPQASAASGFDGGRPALGNGTTPGNLPQGFRGDREEGGGLSIVPSLMSILKNIVLFAVSTLVVVALSKLIPKKVAQAQAP